jgi:hypothetical protein
MPVMLETATQARRLVLKLDVDESNIDRLETMSCEETFAQREFEYQESYRAIPAPDELCERYGDPENRRIYMMSRDVEGRWLDLHQRETGMSKPID